ncbi:hypothetical protein ABZ579_29445 [Streptomyces thermolilacinus]
MAAARVFTRMWLALFGWWKWDDLPELPPEVRAARPGDPCDRPHGGPRPVRRPVPVAPQRPVPEARTPRDAVGHGTFHVANGVVTADCRSM